ncbi:hypothetical protein ABFX02_03G062800 [Erythranthe guttata]
MSSEIPEENDKNIEIWKVKKLIKALESARGNGTSMISLIIPPGDQISRVTKMLAEEFGTASNIKSRVNRQSVLGAITSAQSRLKLYSKVPPNGLVLYTGTILTDDGREKKVNFDFTPFRPINASLYLCDNKFHTEPLTRSALGIGRQIRFTVDLPKKHGRGGQSAVRFGRLRMEKRHNYVRKVVKLVDVSYGGETGFNQAIELSAEILSNVKFVQEKRLIGKFFDEISQDSGKYVFGVEDTISSGRGFDRVEWFANEYRNFGCSIEFVTNRSQEGSQFCKGFGGIGGILRYQVDIRSFDETDDDDDDGGDYFEDPD